MGIVLESALLGGVAGGVVGVGTGCAADCAIERIAPGATQDAFGVRWGRTIQSGAFAIGMIGGAGGGAVGGLVGSAATLQKIHTADSGE